MGDKDFVTSATLARFTPKHLIGVQSNLAVCATFHEGDRESVRIAGAGSIAGRCEAMNTRDLESRPGPHVNLDSDSAGRGLVARVRAGHLDGSGSVRTMSNRFEQIWIKRESIELLV